ncbi:MAG: DUF2007 domain-containing protein [Armatimonadota bacterium]|nr:MAG: DUF2007 domain-containing protein [Armatimonadota bacterium]
MPYCPKCRYEYQPSVSVCPECNEPLVPALPPEREPINEPLVVVYEAPEEIIGVMARTVLEEAGISVVVQSGLVPWYDGVRFTARGYHSRLLVFESRADEARRLIAQYLAEMKSGAAEKAVEEEADRETD